MGNNSDKMKMQEWEIIQKNQKMKVFKNKKNGKLVQEYHLTIFNQKQKHKQLEFYQKRKNMANVIQVLLTRQENLNLFIYIQKLSHRLSQLFSLQQNKTQYILFEALKGFKLLYQKYGPFQIQDNMIWIDLKNNIKVWLNDNLAYNHPFPSNNFNNPPQKNQNYMVNKIINCVQKHTYNATFNHFFREKLFSNCPHLTFNNTINFLSKLNIQKVQFNQNKQRSKSFIHQKFNNPDFNRLNVRTQYNSFIGKSQVPGQFQKELYNPRNQSKSLIFNNNMMNNSSNQYIKNNNDSFISSNQKQFVKQINKQQSVMQQQQLGSQFTFGKSQPIGHQFTFGISNNQTNQQQNPNQYFSNIRGEPIKQKQFQIQSQVQNLSLMKEQKKQYLLQGQNVQKNHNFQFYSQANQLKDLKKSQTQILMHNQYQEFPQSQNVVSQRQINIHVQPQLPNQFKLQQKNLSQQKSSQMSNEYQGFINKTPIKIIETKVPQIVNRRNQSYFQPNKMGQNNLTNIHKQNEYITSSNSKIIETKIPTKINYGLQPKQEHFGYNYMFNKKQTQNKTNPINNQKLISNQTTKKNYLDFNWKASDQQKKPINQQLKQKQYQNKQQKNFYSQKKIQDYKIIYPSNLNNQQLNKQLNVDWILKKQSTQQILFDSQNEQTDRQKNLKSDRENPLIRYQKQRIGFLKNKHQQTFEQNKYKIKKQNQNNYTNQYKSQQKYIMSTSYNTNYDIKKNNQYNNYNTYGYSYYNNDYKIYNKGGYDNKFQNKNYQQSKISQTTYQIPKQTNNYAFQIPKQSQKTYAFQIPKQSQKTYAFQIPKQSQKTYAFQIPKQSQKTNAFQIPKQSQKTYAFQIPKQSQKTNAFQIPKQTNKYYFQIPKQQKNYNFQSTIKTQKDNQFLDNFKESHNNTNQFNKSFQQRLFSFKNSIQKIPITHTQTSQSSKPLQSKSSYQPSKPVQSKNSSYEAFKPIQLQIFNSQSSKPVQFSTYSYGSFKPIESHSYKFQSTNPVMSQYYNFESQKPKQNILNHQYTKSLQTKTLTYQINKQNKPQINPKIGQLSLSTSTFQKKQEQKINLTGFDNNRFENNFINNYKKQQSKYKSQLFKTDVQFNRNQNQFVKSNNFNKINFPTNKLQPLNLYSEQNKFSSTLQNKVQMKSDNVAKFGLLNQTDKMNFPYASKQLQTFRHKETDKLITDYNTIQKNPTNFDIKEAKEQLTYSFGYMNMKNTPTEENKTVKSFFPSQTNKNQYNSSKGYKYQYERSSFGCQPSAKAFNPELLQTKSKNYQYVYKPVLNQKEMKNKQIFINRYEQNENFQYEIQIDQQIKKFHIQKMTKPGHLPYDIAQKRESVFLIEQPQQ